MTEPAMENMPIGKLKKNTTGNAIFSGSLSPLRSYEKVQSRYLKPSMASCHDYCKYGKKHDYEAASLYLRTFLKKKRREQNQVATPNGEGKRSITISKPKIEVEPNKKCITPSAKTLLKSRENKQNEVKSPTLHDEKRRKVIKRRTWIRHESSQELNVINSTNLLSPNFEVDASVDSGIAKEITESTVGEPTSPVAPTACNLINLSPASEADISGDTVDRPVVPSVRKVQTIINQNALLPPKRGDVAVRSPIVLKTRTPLLRSISHPKSSRSLITRRNMERKKFGVVASKPVDTLKTTRASLLRSISTRRNPENLRSTNTTETKILKPSRSTIAERNTILKWTPRWILKSSQELNVINSTNLLSPNFEVDASVDSGIAEEITKSTVGEPSSPVAPTACNSINLSPASEADISGDTVNRPFVPSVRKVQTIINQNALLPPKRGDIAVRSPIVLKTRTPLLRSISHLKSSRSLITRRNMERKKFGVVASKPVNTLKTTRASLLRSISTRRNPENLRTTNTTETKILKPSRSTIAERKVPQPPPTSVSSLNPGESRNVKRSNSMKILDHKTDHSQSVGNEGISREGNSRGVRRTWTLCPQNDTPAPYKLKFKQGKVLDLRCDSIGARRLWFRLGKTSAENQNQNGDGFAQKRSLQKKDVGASDSKVTDSEPRAVVLKHQDTEENKKDGQALFNHVIEETASKLVVARKSKVKALVGAFETVISLQESKPVAVVSTV